MKRNRVRRTIVALSLASAAAFPVGSAWLPSSSLFGATSAHAATVTAKKYKGTAAQTRWGTIQAVITVKNKKIVSVSIAASSDTARSQVIQSQALPILRSETLKTQSANINQVSGATDVSTAYIQSLQAAIKTAQQHRALK